MSGHRTPGVSHMTYYHYSLEVIHYQPRRRMISNLKRIKTYLGDTKSQVNYYILLFIVLINTLT